MNIILVDYLNMLLISLFKRNLIFKVMKTTLIFFTLWFGAAMAKWLRYKKPSNLRHHTAQS